MTTLGEVVRGRLLVLVAGAYCVLVAVLPIGFAPGAPPLARAATWAALLCLLVTLDVPRRRIALYAGTVGVLGGSLGVFAAVLWEKGRVPAQPLAVLGFFALALAWGALSSPAAHPGAAHGTSVAWLRPRRSVPAWQVTLGSLTLLSLPLLLLLPLSVESPARATFALVLALCLVLLLARECTGIFTRAWLGDATPTQKSAHALRRVAEVALVSLALAAVLWLPGL